MEAPTSYFIGINLKQALTPCLCATLPPCNINQFILYFSCSAPIFNVSAHSESTTSNFWLGPTTDTLGLYVQHFMLLLLCIQLSYFSSTILYIRLSGQSLDSLWGSILYRTILCRLILHRLILPELILHRLILRRLILRKLILCRLILRRMILCELILLRPILRKPILHKLILCRMILHRMILHRMILQKLILCRLIRCRLNSAKLYFSDWYFANQYSTDWYSIGWFFDVGTSQQCHYSIASLSSLLISRPCNRTSLSCKSILQLDHLRT